MIPPCKNCQDRSVDPNCHGICERYKKYKEKMDIAYRNRKSEIGPFLNHTTVKTYLGDA